MLSSILNSDRAIQVDITIIRVFVRLRQMLATHKDLAAKLAELETRLKDHDEQILAIFEAIRALMASHPCPKTSMPTASPADPRRNGSRWRSI